MTYVDGHPSTPPHNGMSTTPLKSILVTDSAKPPIMAVQNDTNTSSSSSSKKKSAKPKKRKKVWSEAYDASSGLNYYYNRLTNVTTWDRPTDEELSLYCDEDADNLSVQSNGDSSTDVQNSKSKIEAHDVTLLIHTSNNQLEIPLNNNDEGNTIPHNVEKEKVWKIIHDPNYNQPYYYNKLTNVTTWDKPTEEELEQFIADEYQEIHGRIIIFDFTMYS